MIEGRNQEYGNQMLRLLYKEPGLSRSDFSDRLSLDRGTVSRIVAQLIDLGYVIEGEGSQEPRDQAGRKKVPLFINDRGVCSLGLEVQQEFIKYGALSPNGSLLFSDILYRSPKSNLVDDIVGAVSRGLAGCRNSRILGVGIALSGLVDPLSGRLLFSASLGVTKDSLPLVNQLEARLNISVFIDNDAKCCCYDVLHSMQGPCDNPGAGGTLAPRSSASNFIYTFCEFIEDSEQKDRYSRIGIGTALVIHDSIYYGSRFAAGEFRTIYADPAIPGQFGRVSCDYFFPMRTDPELRALFIHDLAGSMAYLANYLDIQLVYMGGGIERYAEEMQHAFDQAIAATWLYQRELPRRITIQFDPSGEKPALRGAAAMVLRHVFLGPVHGGKRSTGLAYLQELAEASSELGWVPHE
ncbi:MAG: ROK family transcriptional regulator [Termitinemataceae bacterium]